jgi:hypothetical protein
VTLAAVLEALRMNPDRYAVIYNSKYENSTTTVEMPSTSPHSSTKVHQNHYYNEYHEGIIEIANSLLKMLLNQLVDMTMVAHNRSPDDGAVMSM